MGVGSSVDLSVPPGGSTVVLQSPAETRLQNVDRSKRPGGLDSPEVLVSVKKRSKSCDFTDYGGFTNNTFGAKTIL